MEVPEGMVQIMEDAHFGENPDFNGIL